MRCAPNERDVDDERPFGPANPYPFDTARGTFAPNPDFHPVKPAIGTQRFSLSQEGEVIVIQGDSRTVAGDAVGGFGITEDNAIAIIQDVLAMYPDEFDTIQMYPTFPDQAAGGSAFYASISNSVQGIGADTFNGRPSYGLPAEGRLSGWSNMNDIQAFATFDTATIPKGPYYSVISQELSHRWLMYLGYPNPDHSISDELKGRQNAHWSALVNAYGSCQDGIFWVDNGDDTFTHMGQSDNGFAPFDKYAMGIRSAEETEATFKINEATLNGNPLEKTSHSEVHSGSVVHGHRFDISIEDVINGLGKRNPPAGTETPYYRVALVLVTAPGQSRTDWEQYLTTLQAIQQTYPDTWKEWTEGAGAICTKVSSRCPEPIIGIESFKALDGNDNNLAPGEMFDLELALRNDGIGTAEDVRVAVTAASPGVTVLNGGVVTAPAIGEAASAVLPHIQMMISADTPCKSVVQLAIRETTKEGPSFSQIIELPVGTRVERYDAMEEAPDWVINPDGTDTTTGAWALGQTQFESYLGEIVQPAEDHTPGNGKLSFGTVPSKGASPTRGEVDRGKTTLESPVFALRGMRDPQLVFYAWHVAENFVASPPENQEYAALVVKGSDDGGETWKEMLRYTETTKDWTRVEIRIRDQLALTNKVRFRFEIEEIPNETFDPLIEAGIDDLSIVDYLEVCNVPGETPDGGVVDAGKLPGGMRDTGCGCDATSGGGLASFGALFLIAALFFSRREKN